MWVRVWVGVQLCADGQHVGYNNITYTTIDFLSFRSIHISHSNFHHSIRKWKIMIVHIAYTESSVCTVYQYLIDFGVKLWLLLFNRWKLPHLKHTVHKIMKHAYAIFTPKTNENQSRDPFFLLLNNTCSKLAKNQISIQPRLHFYIIFGAINT